MTTMMAAASSTRTTTSSLAAAGRPRPLRQLFGYLHSPSFAPASPFVSPLVVAARSFPASPWSMAALKAATAATALKKGDKAVAASFSHPFSPLSLAALGIAPTAAAAAAPSLANSARLAIASSTTNTTHSSTHSVRALRNPGSPGPLQSSSTDHAISQSLKQAHAVPGPGGHQPSYSTFQESGLASHTRLLESRREVASKLLARAEENLATLWREFETTTESHYEASTNTFSRFCNITETFCRSAIEEFVRGERSFAVAIKAVDMVLGPAKECAMAAARNALMPDTAYYPREKLAEMVRQAMDRNKRSFDAHVDDVLRNDPHANVKGPLMQANWADTFDDFCEVVGDFEKGELGVDLRDVDYCGRNSSLFRSIFISQCQLTELGFTTSPASSRASSRASSPGPEVGELLPPLDFSVGRPCPLEILERTEEEHEASEEFYAEEALDSPREPETPVDGEHEAETACGWATVRVEAALSESESESQETAILSGSSREASPAALECPDPPSPEPETLRSNALAHNLALVAVHRCPNRFVRL
ncbi:hypothetical protein DFJ73DRAFT_781779 [Zopfochytrium polystomum]|nr:hypothetical protein DFJ73DRAFT_899826 [Zopfochytrium polystomum]KAI9330791.1 hypothetical protein DFJ73DRAFT_781779 [Zopfochytrium polystomum]